MLGLGQGQAARRALLEPVLAGQTGVWQEKPEAHQVQAQRAFLAIQDAVKNQRPTRGPAAV